MKLSVFTAVVLTAISLTAATSVSAAPQAAQPSQGGFFCPATSVAKFTRVAPKARISGIAEIDECFGLAFLRISVKGKFPSSGILPVINRGNEPLMGPQLTISANKAEALWTDVASAGIPGGGLSGLTLRLVDATSFETQVQTSFK